MAVQVFISSTREDLLEERRALTSLLVRFSGAQFVGMEHFGARDEPPLEASLQEVDRSDLYVGVFGRRYGSGITEREYLRARERKLPCHIYWKSDAAGAEDESDEQHQKRDSLRIRLQAAHTVVGFREPIDLVQAVAADLHRFLTERLISAVKSVRPPHANRVRRFVEEYVGSPEAMVPFGGRAADLAMLDSWLDDEAGAPYCLLVAPAGRGKSALLVRWSSEVAVRGNRVVIFFPVSIRFRTNQEAVASAYLRGRFSEVFADPAPVGSFETIDGTLDEYLSRPLPDERKLLLVIDGIDEAAGWEAGPYLFPDRPATGVRVVVSVRGRLDPAGDRSWRRQFGWESSGRATVRSLGPLTTDGIAEVLVQTNTSSKSFSETSRLVDELYRLTGGDPLLVRLYLDEIADGATLESLTGRPPGLNAFLDRWWTEQRALWGQEGELAVSEKTAESILGLLACALGPLRREEIVQLSWNDRLTSAELDRVMPSLSRLVIGDGNNLPYAFAHPEFGRYYAESRLTEAERSVFMSRFLDWGRVTVHRLESGELPPNEAPGHLVANYGAYLERDSSSADAKTQALRQLVSDAWRKAWYEHEGEAYSGFLADVARVRKAAREVNQRSVAGDAPAPMLGVELRAALYHSSIRNRPAQTPPKLFALFLAYGVLDGHQALESVRRQPDPIERAEGLAQLVPYLKADDRVDAVEEAFEIAQSTRATPVVRALAPYLGERLSDALEIGRSIHGDPFVVEFLHDILPHIPRAMLSQVRPLIDNLEGRHFVKAVGLLIDSAPAEEHAGLLKEMYRAIEAMPFDGDKVLALCDLARHKPEFVDVALSIAESILTEERYFLSGGSILSVLARRLDPARHWARAWKLYKSAETNIENDVIGIIGLATRFPNAVEEVRRLAKLHGPAEDPAAEDWLVRKERWEAILVFHLPPEEREARGSQHLATLVETAGSDSPLSGWEKEKSLELLSQLPEGWAIECLEHATRVQSDAGRAVVLEALLPRIPRAQRHVVLRRELDRAQIHDEHEQVTALSALVAHAPGSARQHLAEDVRSMIGSAGYSWRWNTFSRIARWLAPDAAEALVRETFSRIEALEHEFDRSDALAALAPFLPADLHRTAIEQALALLASGHSDFGASNALLAYMSDEERNRAFEMMMEQREFLMGEMRWSLSRLFGAAIRFLSEDQIERLLRAAAAAEEWDRAEVLAITAAQRRLSDAQVAENVAVVRSFTSAAARVRGLSALSAHLPKETSTIVWSEAVAAARSIEDNPAIRARAFTRLVGAATAGAIPELAAEALNAADAVAEAKPQAEAYRALFVEGKIGGPDRLRAFERMLDSADGSRVAGVYGGRVKMASLGRGFLLECIAASTSSIADLGGETAVEECFNAIRDAADFWP